MSAPVSVLQDAISKRTHLYNRAIDRLRELSSPESENEVYDLTLLLREAIELAQCGRRLVAGRSAREIHAAFGAPGDFGYEHPIGAALNALYSAKAEDE